MLRQKETPTNQLFPILFDKYALIRRLGSGSFCTTYLVRHISLEQERALKCYPKTSADTVSDLMEARVLRDLLHPGIPLIYDTEEDEQYFYVIEEYVRGENLLEFLQHQPTISTEYFYNFSFALCDIFSYLHSRSHTPVLYRDLKPEHLIVSGGRVRLLDFNICAFAHSADNNLDHFGNPGFSAPENYTSRSITFASDIYSIGKLLEYLSEHLENKPTRTLRKILQQASHPEPSLRFETVEELSAALLAAQEKKRCAHLEQQTIAIVSSHHGCGATHLAIALTSFLNYAGISAVCYEKNSSDSLRSAAESLPYMEEKSGVYRYCFFHGMPDYGPGVSLPDPISSVRIFDCGTDPDRLPADCDLILLIATGAIWRRQDLLDKNAILQSTGIPMKIIGNFCFGSQALKLAAFIGRPIYRYPVSDDPFRVAPRTSKLFRRILGLKKGRKGKCCLQENEHDLRAPYVSGSQVSDTTQE